MVEHVMAHDGEGDAHDVQSMSDGYHDASSLNLMMMALKMIHSIQKMKMLMILLQNFLSYPTSS